MSLAWLHHLTLGDGPPLLMIAGAGGDADPFAPAAAALATDFQVISYDRRANSRTGRPPETTADLPALALHADDAAALLDHLGIEQAAVIGTSGGACIALELARRRPDKVARLLLHEPALVHALRDGPQLHKNLRAQLASDRDAGGPRHALERFLRFAYGDDAWESLPATVTARILDNAAVFLDEEFEALTSTRPPDGDEPLPPAAVLVGADSPPFLRPLCERVADTLDAPLLEVAGGHLAYFTHPGPFVRAVHTAMTETR